MSSPDDRHADPQLLASLNALEFFKLIGLRIVDLRPGWSKLEIDWRPDLCQPLGIMHGGVIATMIDSGIAYALVLSEVATQGAGWVSVDLRVKYLRPASAGTLVCESTIPRLGRQIIHGESIVRGADGKEIARGDSIYMVVGRGEKAHPGLGGKGD
ncbi:MAG: PaaI family thioesterase [Pirellulales bacterium]|nr:PaaI family thioesterase [Pirellulales bacterium]